MHVDAPRAEGSVTANPAPTGLPVTLGGRTTSAARRVVPYHPVYGRHGATLYAKSGSPGEGPLRQLEIARRRRQGPRTGMTDHSPSTAERRGRGDDLPRRGDDGAVECLPAEPRRRHRDGAPARARSPARPTSPAAPTGPPAWTGSLRMPIFGGDPVRLAGPGFRATLHKGITQDE